MITGMGQLSQLWRWKLKLLLKTNEPTLSVFRPDFVRGKLKSAKSKGLKFWIHMPLIILYLVNCYDWLLLRYYGRERSIAWDSSGIWKIMKIVNKSDQNSKSKLRHFGGWLNLNWTLKIKESDQIHAQFTHFLDRAKADICIYCSNGKVGKCWWSRVPSEQVWLSRIWQNHFLIKVKEVEPWKNRP